MNFGVLLVIFLGLAISNWQLKNNALRQKQLITELQSLRELQARLETQQQNAKTSVSQLQGVACEILRSEQIAEPAWWTEQGKRCSRPHRWIRVRFHIAARSDGPWYPGVLSCSEWDSKAPPQLDESSDAAAVQKFIQYFEEIPRLSKVLEFLPDASQVGPATVTVEFAARPYSRALRLQMGDLVVLEFQPPKG